MLPPLEFIFTSLVDYSLEVERFADYFTDSVRALDLFAICILRRLREELVYTICVMLLYLVAIIS